MASPADDGSGAKDFLFQYLQQMDDMYSKNAGRIWGWTDEMGVFHAQGISNGFWITASIMSVMMSA